MRLITLDYETFYASKTGYTLKKMMTDEYIDDSRYETIGVSVKQDAGVVQWYTGTHDEIASWLARYDWANAAVCCHHTQFDGYIMTKRFGIRPKLWMDTLSMARARYPWLVSHSLDALSQFMGKGKKGHEVVLADGKHRKDFTPQELAAYGAYCSNDVQLTYEIAQDLLATTPPLELQLIDMTVRMFTEPEFIGDQNMLADQYEKEVARKAVALKMAETDRDTIMSNPKFAQALSRLGVKPPMKISRTTNKSTYAFAKTDKEFTALLEHDNPDVQALVGARLGVKSTIAETRVKRFLERAKAGPLPVYLNYWGAKVSGRYSGGNKTNWQNLSARGPSAGIRNAICAPTGAKLVVGDSANIELRVALACAGETEALKKLAAGEDLYCEFASRIFGRPITKADKIERQLGKTAILGLQYGCGAERFLEMVRIDYAKIGIKSAMTLEEAERVVYLYRDTYFRLPKLWRYCGDVILPAIYNNDVFTPVDVNGWAQTFGEYFAVPGYPGVTYYGLRKDNDGWVYTMGREEVRIYSSKVVENLCQYLARMIVMWQTARINKRYKVSLSVHDEAVCVVPDDEVDACREYMNECLTMAPAWCKGLPLSCEIGVGQTYGSAK